MFSPEKDWFVFFAARDPRHPKRAGGDVLLWNLAAGLARHGANVDFLCMQAEGLPAEEQIEGIRVRRIGSRVSLSFRAAITYLREYRGRVRAVVEEVVGGSALPFFAPAYVREPILAMWYQANTKVFRAQFRRPLSELFVGAERVLGLMHDRTAGIITCTADRIPEIAKLTRARPIVEAVPGLNEDWMRMTWPTPLAARAPQIIYLGKLRRYKSPHHVLRALSLLAAKVPNATLVLAGRAEDPGYLEELRTSIADLHLAGRVRIEVDITEDRKKELLKESKCLVLPSPIEGFGIVILEANACGVPVIATEGTPTQALEDGENGLRYQFGDVEGLAKAIESLIRMPNLAAWEARCVAWADRFRWENTIQPFLRLAGAV